MNKRYLIGFILACALLLSACTSPGSGGSADIEDNPQLSASVEDNAYHKITAEKAKEMIDAGDVTVVDVRTAEEYAEAHIPSATLVPVETISDEMPAALPDKDAVLLVYCRTGIRSKQASDKLVELGYSQIYDLGGIVDWPYEKEGGDSE